ncbi:replication endonuclease, partial [Klebsiella pneumoniae]|nr:replication endonuclease [Klebsiella pneumoniae]
QLRAVCLVNRIVSEFVSHDALIERREQRRKNLDYISANELVNDEGVTLNMEDVYYASASNPVIRRIEMMATVKGLSLVAEQRGDCAVYCTITTPSKYHASTSDGRPNPKWSGATVRESSDYLVDMFASVRKSL